MGDTQMFSLPPLIGADRHDPRKARAPAWSFRSRYSRTYDDSPGPAYNVDSSMSRYGRVKVNAATITGRPTPRLVKDKVPGPIYNTDQSPRYKQSPSFTFGLRPEPNFDFRRPGPTSYSLPTTLGSQTVGYRGSRAAALRGRNDKFGFAHDWSNSPGPAAYNASDDSMKTKRAPVYTFKGRNYAPGYKMETPGPGAYQPLYQPSIGSPRFSIGVKHSDKAIPMMTMADVGE